MKYEILILSSDSWYFWSVALKGVVGKQSVNDEALLTFMAEVESLMNGHPLTHVSTDYREEALTPNHFLFGWGNPNFPPDVVNDKDLCSQKKWKHAQVMTQHFWKRWLQEYVPALTEHRSGERMFVMFVKEILQLSSMRLPLMGVGCQDVCWECYPGRQESQSSLSSY